MIRSTCTARFAAALFLLCLLPACNHPKRSHGDAGSPPELGDLLYDSQKYGIESAVIEYEVTGYEDGTEVLSFDDYGIKEARVVRTSSLTGTGRNTLEIYRGPRFYRIQLNENWGLENDRPEVGYILTQQKPLQAGEWTAHILETGGFIQTGTAELLDRPCTVWKHAHLNLERWVWKGIVLRTQSHGRAGFTSVATEIDEDPDFPDGRFDVPEGIRME